MLAIMSAQSVGSGRYISPDSSVPVRKFTYLPLKPHLSRLFGTASTAAVLQSHTTLGRNGKFFDIQQSSAWDAAYGNGGIFGGDPRGISLAMHVHRWCKPVFSHIFNVAYNADIAQFAKAFQESFC